MRAIAPDAQHSHREAEASNSRPHSLIPHEELDLAADLLAIDLLVQHVVAASLFSVRVVQHLVARHHAARGGLLPARLRERRPLLGRRGRAGRVLAQDRRGHVVGEAGAEAEDGGVEEVGVAVARGREGEGEEEGRARDAGERGDVRGCGRRQRPEGFGGRRGRGELEERRGREGREGVGGSLVACVRSGGLNGGQFMGMEPLRGWVGWAVPDGEAQARGLRSMTRGSVTGRWETYCQETEGHGPDELEDGHLSGRHFAQHDNGTKYLVLLLLEWFGVQRWKWHEEDGGRVWCVDVKLFTYDDSACSAGVHH